MELKNLKSTCPFSVRIIQGTQPSLSPCDRVCAVPACERVDPQAGPGSNARGRADDDAAGHAGNAHGPPEHRRFPL